MATTLPYYEQKDIENIKKAAGNDEDSPTLLYRIFSWDRTTNFYQDPDCLCL